MQRKSRGIRLLHWGAGPLLMVLACHWFHSGGISYPLLAAYHLVMLFLATNFAGGLRDRPAEGQRACGKKRAVGASCWGLQRRSGVIVLCLAAPFWASAAFPCFPGWEGRAAWRRTPCTFSSSCGCPSPRRRCFAAISIPSCWACCTTGKLRPVWSPFLFALLHLVNNGIWFQFFGLRLGSACFSSGSEGKAGQCLSAADGYPRGL